MINTTYTVTIIAVAESYRDSDQSEERIMTLQEGEEVVLPEQPMNIGAVLGMPGDRSVLVSWDTLADSDGAPITAYQVLWNEAGSEGEDTVGRVLGSDEVSYQVEGLAADTTYEFTVLSYNRYGSSEEAS